jgi:tripartite-type tricarboxylate transporter receptor subunit TctC
MKITAMMSLIAGIAMTVFAAPVPAQATYPTKSIRLIIPFSPGGGTDTFGRIVGQKLQERLGQAVVVENKPGAGGNIGADMVAKSSPDGYTLLLAQDSLAVVPWLFKSLPFDVTKDFAPIGIGVFMPMVLVTSNKLPATSLSELVAYAKANPGKLSYGSPGTGTAHHLNFETFLTLTGTQMVHVPYKGATPMMADLTSGNVDVAFSAVSSAQPMLQANRIRILAVADRARLPQMKEVPAIAETYPGYMANVWFGLMAPAGTPQDITNKLSAEMREVLNLPDVRERLTGLGYQIKPTTPDEMRHIMNAEYEKWGKVVKAVGIQAE